ncbi:hypothetical protein AYL99_05816 [Fonsecaea erecta]|uniref:Uncharacterized protein n=1 Tax=Fonsecaea erecta TaxID=1367422 RepID=A0A178ZLX9_9EURO|nr:hypothetical protein AYL99_05816 [Fonsecaea erecta]OAP60814.1 hypothetical protein AYL99_05816 [Fonsecaea erecta]
MTTNAHENNPGPQDTKEHLSQFTHPWILTPRRRIVKTTSINLNLTLGKRNGYGTGTGNASLVGHADRRAPPELVKGTKSPSDISIAEVVDVAQGVRWAFRDAAEITEPSPIIDGNDPKQ